MLSAIQRNTKKEVLQNLGMCKAVPGIRAPKAYSKWQYYSVVISTKTKQMKKNPKRKILKENKVRKQEGRIFLIQHLAQDAILEFIFAFQLQHL